MDYNMNNLIHKEMNDEYEAEQHFIKHINLALSMSEPLYGTGTDFTRITRLFDETLRRFVDDKHGLAATDRSKLTREQVLRRDLKPRHKKSVLERDEYRCTNCGSHKNLCVDHKTPISRGGDNHEDNLHTLCRSCNRYKSNKTMDEWLGVAQ